MTTHDEPSAATRRHRGARYHAKNRARKAAYEAAQDHRRKAHDMTTHDEPRTEPADCPCTRCEASLTACESVHLLDGWHCCPSHDHRYDTDQAVSHG